MPLHSLQRLSPTAVLGLWQLTETPEALWAGLPHQAGYAPLLPVTTDARRQAQWLAGRRLAHALFGELPAPLPAETMLCNEATGRPWLAGAPAATVVSLSHSGAWVAAMLASEGRVGVDIEQIRDKAQRLAGKFLNETEWDHARAVCETRDTAAAAAASAPEEAAGLLHSADTHYTLLWSAKEALYKLAARRGIIFRQQLLLHEFSPQASGEIPATLIVDGARTRHRICYTQPAPGYVLTYCHEPAG
ncbi:MAG: 4'-phosphopantetheinyl transferase superfamily protein [Bacteroidota bacterium]|nr:4'-phosphopantetheinyl transferase superfamily protein [Bacteroidota bacterium]